MEKTDSTRNYFIQSGIKEVHLLRKHLKISGSGENVNLNDISADAIKNFYREYLATVRPMKLRSEKILPKPDYQKLRALYMGAADANVFLNTVVRHSLYVDQILVTDPMHNNLILTTDQGVFRKPGYWAESIANHALSLCAIEEWIKEGIIILIPKFSVYYPQLVANVAHYYKDRIFIPDEYFERNRIDFALGIIARTHPEDRHDVIQALMYNEVLCENEIDELHEKLETYEKQNPIRFHVSHQTLRKFFQQGELPAQIITLERGVPITFATEITKETGSFLIFENSDIYETLGFVIRSESRRSDTIEKVALAFQDVDLPFLNNVSVDKALEIRKKGYLSSFRQYLKEVWLQISSAEDEKELERLLFDFSDKLKAEYSQLEREWESIYKELRIHAAAKGATAGLAAVSVGNFNLTFGLLAGLGVSVLSGLTDYKQFSTEIRKVKQNPLAVFLEIK